MITISKEIEFDAGHRVPNHRSKCRNPHGHRYRVVATITGTIVDESGASDEGMLLDFGDLKSVLVSFIHDPLDHAFIVYEGDRVMREVFESAETESWNHVIFPYIPTAENIARWCWEQIELPLRESFRGNFWLDNVEVWETPTSTATYYGEDDA